MPLFNNFLIPTPTNFLLQTPSGQGVAESTMFAIVRTDFSMSDVNTAQSPFPAATDTWTLPGLTTYFIDGFIFVAHGATSHSVALGFGGTATYTAVSYFALVSVGAANAVAAAQATIVVNTAASTVLNTAAANAQEQIQFSGIMSINAGGTVIPQITYSAAPGGGGAILGKTGTYVRFIPIGSNTIASQGPVT